MKLAKPKAAKKKIIINKPKKEEIIEEYTEPKFTDLRQIMDYDRDFSIFFSGVEYDVYFNHCYEMGVRNFLMSYEYAKTKGSRTLRDHPDIKLFVDSGAFTYMGDAKYSNYTVKDWEKQIVDYLDWGRKHRKFIFAMADLDLQNILGSEVVDSWRKRYFEPFMLETGIPICFVWHPPDGVVGWERMCQRYPYVAFSLASEEGEINLSDIQQKFKVAEKYDTLVQGMGSTHTALLPQLPFYTVDSTTWKIGMRYGLLNVWLGNRLQQVKKDDWEKKAIPIVNNYPGGIAFDWDKLYDDDVEETIHANAYAFLLAEKYIKDRLKSLEYWKKPRLRKVNIDNLSSDFFPTVDWLNNEDSKDIEKYAINMNINPKNGNETFNAIYDMTVFLNWDNPDYASLKSGYYEDDSETLMELHDLYINRIVPDNSTRVYDLIAFFKDCLSGNNDKLLLMGTNFDRLVKERDSYVKEEIYDYEDVEQKDLIPILSRFLPPASEDSSAPEIDSLDDEIFSKANIIPVRDDTGKFIKGIKQLPKRKDIYSEKFPRYACDTCYAAQKCPEYKAGMVCAYKDMFKRFDTRNLSDIIQAIQGMVSHNLTRMQRAMIIEVMNGGMPDEDVTNFINQNTKLLTMLKDIYEHSNSEVLRQTRLVRADGSSETTTQLSNPQNGGILEKLFGNLTEDKKSVEKPKEDESIIIDVTQKKRESVYKEYDEDGNSIKD